MKPDENDNRRMGTPLIPQRSYVHTPPSNTRDSATQVAAANIVRDQIGAIYDGNTTTPTPQTTPVAPTATPAQAQTPQAPVATTTAIPQQQPLVASSPYQQTQVNSGEIQKDQWKQYHSAWQDYYQKYYERYYVGQVQRTSRAIEARAAQATQSTHPVANTAARPIREDTTQSTRDEHEALSREEAVFELRNKLRSQIQLSAVKVRKSRHFMPIAAAVCVVVLFLFLQYNRVLIANVQAYISPGNVDPANIIVAPTADVAVGPEPKLIIPKINVDVPVDYAATPDNASQMSSMKNGVAYFGIPGANSMPGQIGNTVIAGHSSNDLIDQGAYKFIFLRLDTLVEGDTIYLNKDGKRYVYSITRMEVVKPSEVGKLIYPTDKPLLTLITCTPRGTATNRLLVTAEQISPAPTQAAPAPVGSGSGTGPAAEMPGNSPTFMERVFGG